MNKVNLWALTLTSFLITVVISSVIVGYLLLSMPPFSRAVLPDMGTLIVVLVSVAISVLLSIYISRKVYLRFGS